MNDLPSGTVTFLFTDIEDSTRLLIDLGRETFVRCLGEHDTLIRAAITDAGGMVVKSEVGAFFAVFQTGPAAVQAVVEAQSSLQSNAWPKDAFFRVKMGLHTGTGTIGGDDYVGIDVHRAARIAAAGFGGQVLLSSATAAIVRPTLPEGVGIVDLGEYELKDLEAESLHQLRIRDLISEFPPLEVAGPTPTNLPVSSTKFVGRNKELAEVRELVEENRFVTLAGVAGAGKTRLALEVAASLGDEFADGVWLVDLSTITDPDLVAAETAYSVGIQERQGASVRDTLFEYLAQRHALLVFDNCEHLILAVAEFVNVLLSIAPDCRVVATSRELLRVGGEVAYRVGSMGLPQDAPGTEPLEIGEYDAVRLFVARGAAVKPGFSLTAEIESAVAEICVRLDGIPLAIELAAVQLRIFTPRQIVENLEERFQMLSGGFRTADPRQQTLDAAIDWSYQLLDDHEQRLFARLSVFRGGFDLEAAQQVCSGQGIEEYEVFGLVLALTDKSLITADVGGEVARYRLLEMLRQFANDKLDDAAESDAIQRRHAQHFVHLAEESEPNIRGETEKKWWDRIDTEMDNLGLAMEWSIDVGEPELGMRLAGAIWRFWKVTFRYSAGVRWLSRLSEAGTGVDDIVRAKVLVGLGTLMSYTDAPAAARELLEKSIEIYRDLDEQGIDPTLLRHGYPSAVLSLATNVWQHDQDYDGATELWVEALDVARRTGDDAGASAALGNLAEAAARKGDVQGARDGYIESISASYALNSTHRTVEAITLSAVFEMSIDEPARAIPLLDDAVEMARSDDLPFWDDFGLAMRAVASHDLGESGAHERFRQHAAKLFANDEFLATYYYQLPLMLGRADMEHTAGRPDRAANLLGALERLEDENSPLEPIFEGTRRDRLLEVLPEELGEGEFAAAFERGKVLPRHEVVNLAVES